MSNLLEMYENIWKYMEIYVHLLCFCRDILCCGNYVEAKIAEVYPGFIFSLHGHDVVDLDSSAVRFPEAL